MSSRSCPSISRRCFPVLHRNRPDLYMQPSIYKAILTLPRAAAMPLLVKGPFVGPGRAAERPTRTMTWNTHVKQGIGQDPCNAGQAAARPVRISSACFTVQSGEVAAPTAGEATHDETTHVS